MKRFPSLALVGAIACLVIAVPAHAASSRENRRLHAGKITKNEAQHLVLKKFPGAKIGTSKLEQGKSHSVWVIEVVKPGATGATPVRVDGRSGQILP